MTAALALAALALATVPEVRTPPAEPRPSLSFDQPFVVAPEPHLLFTAQSTAHLMEQFALPVLLQVDTGAGASHPGTLRMSQWGGSWRTTRWFLGGHDLTDPLSSGTPALRPPSAVLGRLHLLFDEHVQATRGGGPRFELRRGVGHEVGIQAAVPNLGGPVLFARPFVDLTSGKHATGRTVPPPDTRGGPLWGADLWASGSERGLGVQWRYAAWAQSGRKRTLAFIPSGGLKSTAHDDWQRTGVLLEAERSASTVQVGLQVEQQSLEFSERRHAPEQSAQRRSVAASLGLRNRGGSYQVLFSHRRRRARDRSFVLGFADPDGESLEPFFVDGQSLGLRLEGEQRWGPAFITVRQDILHHRPDTESWSHELSYEGQSYGRWDLSSARSTQFLGEAKVGVKHEYNGDALSLRARLFIAANHLMAVNSGPPLISILPAGTVRLEAVAWPLRPFLTLARVPINPNTQWAELLDSQYLQAELHTQDGRLVETRRADAIQRSTFGQPPSVLSAVLGGRWEFWNQWRLDGMGMFRAYDGLFELRLRSANQGSTANGVFIFNEGPSSYEWQTSKRRAVQFGLHVQLHTARPDWFFSLGASAYNAVGKSAFGIGPDANDPTSVNYADANPNSRRFELANLDADRGFMVKSSGGLRLWRCLWASFALRFRDGQPFSFYDVAERDGQLSRQYHSNRGSPLKAGRPLLGPREDFQLQTDLRLAWTSEHLNAWLTLSNAFDFNNEVQEVSGQAGIDGRAALETQIPRALMVGLSFR